MSELAEVLFGPENQFITVIAVITALLNAVAWYFLFKRWNYPALLLALVPPLQAALFLFGIGMAQTPGYDPSGSMSLGPTLGLIIGVIGPMALFHFISDKPLRREGLHELDQQKLLKFGRSFTGFFMDPGMLCGGPVATFWLLHTLRSVEKAKNDAAAFEAAEGYREDRYPIVIPPKRTKLILVLLGAAFLCLYGSGFPYLVSDSLTVGLLFLGVTTLIVIFFVLYLDPVIGSLRIHPDEVVYTTVRGRSRIPFQSDLVFSGGSWVEAKMFRTRANIGAADGIPSEFKLSGFALAHLLNRALEEFRSRDESNSVDDSGEHP